MEASLIARESGESMDEVEFRGQFLERSQVFLARLVPNFSVLLLEFVFEVLLLEFVFESCAREVAPLVSKLECQEPDFHGFSIRSFVRGRWRAHFEAAESGEADDADGHRMTSIGSDMNTAI